MKYLKLGIRITLEQNSILREKAKAAGFTQLADYVRSSLLMSLTTEEKINKIYEKVCKNGYSFENERGERRSFFCSNQLWKEIKEETKSCYSVSQYIRLAFIEKMKRDETEKNRFMK